jgi:cytochrome P450 family 110
MATQPTRSTLPPGPRSRTRQTIAWIRDPVDLLQRCAQQYGDPFTLNLWAFGPTVCTSRPEGIRAIFTAPPDIFASNIGLGAGPLLGEQSVFLMDGARHKQERALLMPPFHGARMKAYGRLMQDVALRHAAAWQLGLLFRMYDSTQAISLENIIQAVFGVQDVARVRLFETTIVAFFRAFTPLIGFVMPLRRELGGVGPWSHFRRAAARFERLMAEEIAARRDTATTREDILSLLVQARYPDGSPLTEAGLQDELKTLLFAGHETVAIGLAWAFYFIHRQPEVSRRLQDELAPLGHTPHPDDLVHLPYLGAVCDEALRLHPSVSGVPRKLKQPFTLLGHNLPPGAAVFPSIVTTHLDPRLYPEALAFRPERFLERTYTPFEYLPFGGGARRCVGAAFALYEMKIVLGSILARYRLALAEDEPITAVTRTFTNAPRGGVRMMLTSRA